MFEFMQKHRKIVMVFTIIFIGIPLAFFVPGIGGSSRDQDIAMGMLPVVEVGDTVVTSGEFLELYGQYTDLRTQQGMSTEAIDMLADGTIDQIVDQLVQRAMVTRGSASDPVLADREFLQERLKEYSLFQDQSGEFSPALYNQWVEGNTRMGTSWDSVFESVAEDVKRESYVKLLEASAFVPESDVREMFVRSKQMVKVKYLPVTPDTTRSEEQLKAHFDENKDMYQTLEGRTIDYVSFSLVPPLPSEVSEAITRARAGEDFAALVEEYSVGADKYDGGDMGWIEVTEEPTPQQEAIFALEPGQVSDPVESFTEIHVYKLEEERIREEDDTMEVRARRIVFRPSISAEERMAIENKANAFLDKVKSMGDDLRAAATEEGLSVSTTPAFDPSMTEIEGIHENDVLAIRQGTLPLLQDEVTSTVVSGVKNLYVAKVASMIEPRPKTFEEAREDVERDAEMAYRMTDEYRDIVQGILEKVESDAESLADVARVAPELADVEIGETREFGAGDMLFQDGLFWNAQEAFALVIDAEPGTIQGPITDFRQEQYFLELVEVIEPEPEVLEAEWQESKADMVDAMRTRANTERQLDYLQYKSEQAQHVDGIVMRYDDAINEILGIDETQFVVPADDRILEELESTLDPVVDDAPADEAPAAEESTTE